MAQPKQQIHTGAVVHVENVFCLKHDFDSQPKNSKADIDQNSKKTGSGGYLKFNCVPKANWFFYFTHEVCLSGNKEIIQVPSCYHSKTKVNRPLKRVVDSEHFCYVNKTKNVQKRKKREKQHRPTSAVVSFFCSNRIGWLVSEININASNEFDVSRIEVVFGWHVQHDRYNKRKVNRLCPKIIEISQIIYDLNSQAHKNAKYNDNGLSNLSLAPPKNFSHCDEFAHLFNSPIRFLAKSVAWFKQQVTPAYRAV